MKLGGYRRDGTMLVLIPGGMAVLLRGEIASPPIDEMQADQFGPWEETGALTLAERNELGHMLDRARLMPTQAFVLKFPFASKDATPDPAADKPEKGGWLDKVKAVREHAQAIIDKQEGKDKDTDEKPDEKPVLPNGDAPDVSTSPPPTIPPGKEPEKAEGDKDTSKETTETRRRKFKLEYTEENDGPQAKAVGTEPEGARP